MSEDAFADHLRLDSHAAPGRLNPSRTILVIVAAFLIALLGSLPFIRAITSTKAGTRMQPSKWFAPATSDPAVCRRIVRFRKPIVTYWVLVASYSTMGIGLVASRLPFLVAGCIVLWVTYRIARSATGDYHTGVAAAAILASNIQFMESATKSTPDMLQCLFLTLSIWGAVEIIFQQRRESHWYALLYVGAGLAIATKGFLAVILLLFVWGYARFGPLRRSASPHHALGWLGAGVSDRHCPGSSFRRFCKAAAAISTLFEDQIGDRLEGAPTLILPNLALYLLTPLRFFGPWLVLLGIALLAQRDLLVGYVGRHKPLVWFVLGWLFVSVVICFTRESMRSRYLLPTYPLTAVLLADLLRQCLRSSVAVHLLERTVRSIVIGGASAGIIVAAAGLRLDTSMLAGGLLSQPSP